MVYKCTFEFENYLNSIQIKKFRIALTKFRLSSHKLEIERGRYHNIPKENRKCKFCLMNTIENEYHFLLICPKYSELRKQYLNSYYCRWPTLNKFDRLLESKDNKTVLKLSKFIFFCKSVKNTIRK